MPLQFTSDGGTLLKIAYRKVSMVSSARPASSGESPICVPTLAEIERTFEMLAASEHSGLGGCLAVDSGRPGPTVGITVCTHGHETSGLAAVWHLTQEPQLRRRLRRGEVIFVLNNLEACRRFFRDPVYRALRDAQTAGRELAISREQSAHFKKRARYIDLDMNRLEGDPADWPKSTEHDRVRSLLPVLATFTGGIDIHGAALPIPPAIVPVHGNWRRAALPIRVVLDGMTRVQCGRPVSYFYGRPGRSRLVVGVETGGVVGNETCLMAIRCANAFLRAAGVLGARRLRAPRKRRYEVNPVAWALFFPNTSYELVKTFAPWESVSKGDILACGKGSPIASPLDGRILFPPPKRRVDRDGLKYEVLFVCRRPRFITA